MVMNAVGEQPPATTAAPIPTAPNPLQQQRNVIAKSPSTPVPTTTTNITPSTNQNLKPATTISNIPKNNAPVTNASTSNPQVTAHNLINNNQNSNQQQHQQQQQKPQLQHQQHPSNLKSTNTHPVPASNKTNSIPNNANSTAKQPPHQSPTALPTHPTPSTTTKVISKVVPVNPPPQPITTNNAPPARVQQQMAPLQPTKQSPSPSRVTTAAVQPLMPKDPTANTRVTNPNNVKLLQKQDLSTKQHFVPTSTATTTVVTASPQMQNQLKIKPAQQIQNAIAAKHSSSTALHTKNTHIVNNVPMNKVDTTTAAAAAAAIANATAQAASAVNPSNNTTKPVTAPIHNVSPVNGNNTASAVNNEPKVIPSTSNCNNNNYSNNINKNQNNTTTVVNNVVTNTDSKTGTKVLLPTPRPPEPHFTVPIEDDPVRRFLDLKARDDPAAPEPAPTEMQEWCELAWHRIPLNIQQAFDSFDMVRLPRSDITHCLFTLNLKSHTILRVDIQRKILAIKLVQRQISLLAVVEVKNDIDKNNPKLATEQHTLIRSLPPTSVWRNPSNRRDTIPDDIPWTSGDIPLFDDYGEVIPGQPILPPPGSAGHIDERSRAKVGRPKSRPQARRKREAALVTPPNANANTDAAPTVAKQGGGLKSRTTIGATFKEDDNVIMIPPPAPPMLPPPPPPPAPPAIATTIGLDTAPGVDAVDGEPDFEPSEYCRLLHVLCETRMRRALEAISRPVAGYDPWNHDIAPLFNDVTYAPGPVTSVCKGVRAGDISALRPATHRYSRSGDVLAARFVQLKKVYVDTVRAYTRRDDEHTLFSSLCPAHVSYAFCLLEVRAHLEPLILRNGPGMRASTIPSYAAKREVHAASASDGAPPVKKRRSDSLSLPVTIHPTTTTGTPDAAPATEFTTSTTQAGDAQSARMRQLHDSVARSDKSVFETEEARVRMVTATLVAIREARAFAAEAASDEDRAMCETVLRQLHAKLSEQVNIQPYR